jgi:hypothetical protein
VAAGISLFGVLLSSTSGTSSDAGSAYQTVLLVVGSLAFIWMLRQKHSAKPPKTLKARDAFYNGMYPLVPFILVALIIALQLLPLAAGSNLLSTVLGSGIAAHGAEKTLWSILFLVLSTASLYMISGSIFALYIVTLPGMMPLKSLRSSRQLVAGKRWTIMRRVLFLPLILMIAAAVLLLPTIMFVTAASEALFFIFLTLSLGVMHAYMYELYRKLL